MAASAGDALPFPIYGGRFRIAFPILDADGDLVTGATSPDSEVSKDQGTFADCTNEATEIATSSGMYYLDLTSSEMQASQVAIIVKSGNGKTTPLVLYPRRYPVLRSGTAQAGAAGTITLDSGASAIDDFYNGCLIQCSNNTPSNVQGQTRWITDYVGSTKVATIGANWGTNPSSSTTFEIYAPETANVAALAGAEPAISTAGRYNVNATHLNNSALNNLVSGRVDASVGALASGVIAAGSFAAGAIDAAAIAADAIGASELAAGAATEIAAAVWDEARSSHVAAGSFGQANQLIRSGTAQAGAAGTITLDASASASDDFYNDCIIFVIGGTGPNQARMITDYTGSSKVANVSPNWITNPSSDSVFVILPFGRVDVGQWADSAPNALISGRVDANAQVVGDKTGYTASVGSGGITSGSFAAGAIDAAAIATDAIGSAELAASAITEIQSGLSTLTAAQVNTEVDNAIADARLDELLAADSDIDGAAPPTVGSVFHELMSKSTGSFTFDQTTDSQEAIRDKQTDIETDTQDIQGRLPAALVSGRIDASVGAMASGVVTASAVATGAIDADALATDAVAEIADGVWDEAMSGHTAAGTFGRVVQIIRDGTAQAGAAGTITLDAGASGSDDFYNNTIITIVGGTGAGQSRIISDYVGSTKVASVNGNWVTNPSSDSVFVILPFGAIPGASAPTAGEVADAVWDEARSGHTTGGSFGEYVLADVTRISGDATSADNLESYTDGTTPIPANATQVSGDATAADNLEAMFDNTGYNASASTIGTVTNVGDKTGYRLSTAGVDDVWDEPISGHNAAGSTGAAVSPIRSNTAQAGGSTSITLDTGASSTDDFYNNTIVAIVGGTGANQARFISDYVGSTKVATVNSAWATNPSSDSIFVILPFASIPGATAPTAAENADAVWDELRSGHVGAGSFGEYVLADVVRISGDATSADNLESYTDGTTPIPANATQWAGAATATDDIALKATLAKGTDITGFNDLSAAQVNAEVDTALDTAIPGSPTANSINERIKTLDDNYTSTRAGNLDNLDAAVSTRATPAQVNTEADQALADYGALKPTVAGRTLDVTAAGEAGIDWANIGSPTTTQNLSGTTVKTATDVETDTQDIQGRLPAALVSGRIDASVGAMAANVITASAIATDAIDADAIAPDAIGASELAADAVTELQSGLATAAALAVVDDFVDTEVAAIKQVTDKLDTALELDGSVYRYTANALEQAPTGGGGGPTAAQIADAVWDEAIADHLGAGSTGLKLNSAGAAGDPLGNTVPGSYPVGTAGYNLGYIDEIKAKTDTLGAAEVEVSSPIAEDGTITVLAGDDYAAEESRTIEFTDTGDMWPTLTGATCSFHAESRLLTPPFTKAMEIVVASGPGKQVRMVLTDTETEDLLGSQGTSPGNALTSSYAVRATLTNGHIVTLATGKLTARAVANGS